MSPNWSSGSSYESGRWCCGRDAVSATMGRLPGRKLKMAIGRGRGPFTLPLSRKRPMPTAHDRLPGRFSGQAPRHGRPNGPGRRTYGIAGRRPMAAAVGTFGAPVRVSLWWAVLVFWPWAASTLRWCRPLPGCGRELWA